MQNTEATQALNNFFANGRDLKFRRREHITSTDESPLGAYMITEGHVKVVTATDSGEENILYIYGPGEVFPLSWLFDFEMDPVMYIAASDVAIRVKRKQEFLDFTGSNSSNMLPIICQQLTGMERIYNLLRGTAHDKIAYSLMSMSRRFGQPHDQHVVINLRLTQQEIASTVHLSRETTGRVLSELENAGAIIQGRKQLRVYPDKLKSLLKR